MSVMIASELIVGETDAIEVGAGAIMARRGGGGPF